MLKYVGDKHGRSFIMPVAGATDLLEDSPGASATPPLLSAGQPAEARASPESRQPSVATPMVRLSRPGTLLE